MHGTYDVHDKLSSDEKIVNNEEKSQKNLKLKCKKIEKMWINFEEFFVDKFEFLVQL